MEKILTVKEAAERLQRLVDQNAQQRIAAPRETPPIERQAPPKR